MTEARLVTREQLAAALNTCYRNRWGYDPQEPVTLFGSFVEDIFAALPAAAPAEGLREALRGLVDAVTYQQGEGVALEQARAALARHESAGSE